MRVLAAERRAGRAAVEGLPAMSPVGGRWLAAAGGSLGWVTL